MTRKRTQNRNGRARGRRQRTLSISLRDRGQTTQDFAVGIGVFILAVAFVFTFLPTILTPFDSSVSGGQTAQADRIADRLVDNLSDSDTSPNTINGTAFDEADGELDKRVGLRTAGDQVSVQIEQLNESETVMSIGHEYNGQSAASSARIVTINEPPSGLGDEAAYRLVVRVW